MTIETIDVAFAVEPEGSIVAIMPEAPGSVGRPNECICYAHIGQHSSGDIGYFTDNCRQATPAEHAELLAELVCRGYDVNVIALDQINHPDYTAARVAELQL